VAGTVEALGQGVDGPPVGTPVFALVGGDGSTGYAQYALADAQQVIPTPPGLSSDEAAGIVVAGSAAVLMLTEVAVVRPGQTVLVQGAGGGMGGYAVQVAKLLGATVIGSASTSQRRDAALAAGADHVVDPTSAGGPTSSGPSPTAPASTRSWTSVAARCPRRHWGCWRRSAAS
jgi:NADPH:quinone reductase-like Zn-dependent oxidoreductase